MAYTELITAPVTYCPGFIENPDIAYEALLAALPWSRYEGSMYGKPYSVPRDEVWVSPYPYIYSKRTYPAYDVWPPELLAIKSKVEAAANTKYEAVLLNLYRNEKDSVSSHCDDEPRMSPYHPIASVSLGAERLFRMRTFKDKTGIYRAGGDFREELILGNGSLLIMHAGMQDGWKHEVPKSSEPCGGRINLTFRVMTRG
jgi:alkylated DNA repair dioxygenase AlkB